MSTHNVCFEERINQILNTVLSGALEPQIKFAQITWLQCYSIDPKSGAIIRQIGSYFGTVELFFVLMWLGNGLNINRITSEPFQ